jgi:hypothetical protein
MIPDEMLVYEPHHVGYARYGSKWYRVIANYGGGDLVLAPQPASQDEVDHRFCKTGCKKLRYVRKEKWLLRRKAPDEPDDPTPVQVSQPNHKFGYFRLSLAVLAGFGIGVAATVAMLATPAEPLVADLPHQLPKRGSLHQHDKSWWRVAEILSTSKVAEEVQTAAAYQANTQSAKIIVPFNYVADDDKQQTAYLVLTPAHPPLGMMAAKKHFGLQQPGPLRPTGLGPPKNGQAVPPKAQWK